MMCGPHNKIKDTTELEKDFKRSWKRDFLGEKGCEL